MRKMLKLRKPHDRIKVEQREVRREENRRGECGQTQWDTIALDYFQADTQMITVARVVVPFPWRCVSCVWLDPQTGNWALLSVQSQPDTLLLHLQ